jgi:hypothetical protein
MDDQENDMINNSQEEEEKIVQNPSIENHDNSRNTEAIDRNLEQSQSILGEQREQIRHRQPATHSFALWPFPRHLENLSFSAHGLGWP